MEREKNMERISIGYILLMLASVFLASISQVMLKKSAQKTYKNKLYEYLNPLVIGSYTIFIGTTFVSVVAYRGVPLSLGPILEATSYLYITFFGILIFKEKINLKKIVAMIFIIMGILVYSLWG